MRITYAIAMAAGHDAANKQMRADGRCQWNDADWDLACATFNTLMGDA